MPSNFAKTGLLLVVLTLIFIAMGALVGGREGLVIAFIVAIATNLYSFWNSDTVVLKMFGAQELSRSDAPQLFDTTATLAQRAGLPMPRLYLLNTAQPNAFATGRNPSNSAVAVSTGLLDRLDMREVAGVVAHELAHVRNRDTLTMTVAATIAGAISMFATFLHWGMLFGDR
ncbi:MAG: M48 family metalloprotease, partial [Hyphomicrobiaceae bacterium]